MAAGKFPQFVARLDPPGSVARARLHFKPEGWPHWYSVPMKQEGGESRTPEASPLVVSGPGGCQQAKLLATALGRAPQLLVSGPEGVLHAPLVPTGFSSDGVVAASGAGAGAAGTSGAAAAAGTGAAAAGAGAAATGGGISTVVLVVGGVAVAGGAAAVAVVGTSLSSRTATTDAAGHFSLDTGVRGDQYGREPYAVTVVAAGCQNYSFTRVWGNQPRDQVLTLVCP